MAQYETVIGLEVHAQLATQSKIFCACSTAFGKEPNENTCPVCLGLPGSLPVLNRKAVDHAIKAGLAINCDVQNKCVWDRKNYFYPDLPKGYQISQFSFPICLGGYLEFYIGEEKKRVNLTRIHMEEDAGKLVHDHGSASSSHVDLNRAGTPLIEIVSEPELRSAEEASAYLKHLRNILVYLEVCDGNMEEGNFRCDANVSLRPLGQKEFGTRAEIKNLNSFKFLEKAIEYEVRRQAQLLDNGEAVIQETRLFDANKGITQSMRSKEDAHDYRYFPDPDLPPLIISDAWIEKMRAELPELAHQKSSRFQSEYQIPAYDADVICSDKALSQHWESTVQAAKDVSPKNISNVYMTLLLKLEKDHPETFTRISPETVAEALIMKEKGQLNNTMLKSAFEGIAESGKSLTEIINEKGLEQVSDTSELEKIIDEILIQNPDNIAEYRAGKEKLFAFFMGQSMRALKGKGNPDLIKEILLKKLS